ncbi:DUF1559 domain-containing protein [Blastopirellula retiformator]|uniref:Putative major pilin subunit n=1 Tax=Blastopirellula retiformator TaxID=2527970 RepID=A0A5C5V1M1_9BACT|nr:DUF1559 domain-containing protein [Blastopirellula retiformator]TWT31893.1 putative major pilin subunit [Blastopirellula retiformator]
MHCQQIQPNARPQAKGFTLVELLVVIAIIGVLIALLLPAVQQAREAARRMGCQNNLKQMGLGLHNYHDTHGKLPAAYYGRYANAASVATGRVGFGAPGWGWGVMIMPFIEQQNLYDALDMTSYQVRASTHQPLSQTPLSVYRCPSDTGDDLNSTPNRWEHGTSNYLGNYGSKNIATTATIPGAGYDWGNYEKTETGMFSANSAVKLRDVIDGTSNTVMLGEVVYGEYGGVSRRGGLWVGNPYNGGYLCTQTSLSSSTTFRINGSNPSAYSSHHSGGAQFVLVDGSVRFIAETLDGEVINNVADRADGKVLGNLDG